MTGYDILNKAMALLGYLNGEDGFIALDKNALRGQEIINRILSDLKCGEISSLSESPAIGEKKTDALVYGTAMLLALTEGDNGKNKIFADVYNAKRASALAEINFIQDKMTAG